MRVFKSRKFWATVLAGAGLVAAHFGLHLPIEAAASALQWLVSVFVLSIALEDGLKGGKVADIADEIVHVMERRASSVNSKGPVRRA